LSLENQIENWIEQRDTLATQMKSMLEAAEFQGGKINLHEAQGLISAAAALVAEAQAVAASL